MPKLMVVTGGQYGSEAKGHVCGYLSRRVLDLLAIRTGGSQAGHTAHDDDGKPWPLRHVPVAVVTNPAARLHIADGSQVDPEVLRDELAALDASGFNATARLTISPRATVIEARHREQELTASMGDRLGSTCKGVGAAKADRIWRTAHEWGSLEQLAWMPDLVTTRQAVDEALDARRSGTILLEAAQGYALGTHAGHYPQCTSNDCRAVDALSAAGISPWTLPSIYTFESWMVYRTFPIRVAGNSGYLKDETSWEALAAQHGDHIKPEKTTVTQKVRRVGEWDEDLATRSWRDGGGTHSALMFVDYIDRDLAGCTDRITLATSDAATTFMLKVRRSLGHKMISLVGTGPNSIIDRR